jgi:hypothetical protein
MDVNMHSIPLSSTGRANSFLADSSRFWDSPTTPVQLKSALQRMQAHAEIGRRFLSKPEEKVNAGFYSAQLETQISALEHLLSFVDLKTFRNPRDRELLEVVRLEIAAAKELLTDFRKGCPSLCR